MICIISTSLQRAKNWADNQGLERDEWFAPQNSDDLMDKKNFHVIVIDIFPEYRLGWFERIYHLAKIRGKLDRK